MREFSQCTILLVDDIETNIDVLFQSLQDDYQLAVALDGKSALEYAEVYPPDLILLDIMMPEIDGYEVCRRLKDNPGTQDIPIIFLSAKDEIENKTTGFEAGAVDYITKPFDMIEVKARIRTHLSLSLAHQELLVAKEFSEAANKKVTESIQYAKMIQRSLLPNPENVKNFLADSFVIWQPRDIVGGDFIFAERLKNGEPGDFIISVLDCTGHGVPGAFMTLIASFGLGKIIKDEGCHDPGQILRHLNNQVKTSLQQDTKYALSDDGLDAAVCLISPARKTLTFAGAKLPMIYIKDGQEFMIKGDRKSIGYKKSDVSFEFTCHTVRIEPGMSVYLFTDGFADQLGETEERRFGTRRFRNLLRDISETPLEAQKEILLNVFNEYKGENERQDDVTVVGFSFR